MSTDIPQPMPPNQQPKTVEGTARSFFKAGMGVMLGNFHHAMKSNQRNVDRLQDKLEGKCHKSGEPSKGGTDDMRIDSDDIHYHIANQQPKSSPFSSLLKIGLGAAALGTGIGVPLALPSILSGIGEIMNRPAAVQPAETKPDAPTVSVGGKEYELSLEPE